MSAGAAGVALAANDDIIVIVIVAVDNGDLEVRDFGRRRTGGGMIIAVQIRIAVTGRLTTV